MTIFADLHPDLLPYLESHPTFGAILNHPLIRDVGVRSDKILEINDFYRHRTQQVQKAWEECDYHGYVFSHERAYRTDALIQLYFDFGNSRRFWDTAGDVWRDSNNIHRWVAEWRSIWTKYDEINLRRFAMTRYERRYLRQLPEKLTIYRGIGHSDAVQGLSWTLSRKVAAWFACRERGANDGKCSVAIGEASRADVIAYFAQRSEREIVIFPEHVRVCSIEPQVEDVPKPWASSKAKMLASYSQG